MITFGKAMRRRLVLPFGLAATIALAFNTLPAAAVASPISQSAVGQVTVGTAYNGQIVVAGGDGGPVGFTQTQGAPAIAVNSAGVVFAPSTLAVGTYYAAGGDQDNSGDFGSWSFTLHVVPPVSTPAKGYLEVGRDGGIFAFGASAFYGSVPQYGININNIVAAVPDKTVGYWLFGSDGGVFAFGAAPYLGSLPQDGIKVSNIAGAVPTKDDQGYWLIGRDGGVFAFGDAGYLGSIPQVGVSVNNIVDIAPTSDDQGYWMVGSDGGVFNFGDAPFFGSLPYYNIVANNVVAIVTGGLAYYIITSDGTVYDLVQSLKSIYSPSQDIVGAADSGTGAGTYLVGADGGVFSFGDAPYFGSLPGLGISVNNIVALIPGG